MSATHRWVVRLAILLALPVTLRADTLFLRDGSRVQGELISVRNGTIEFEERRGFGGNRTVRFDTDEVLRIEFDRNNTANNTDSGGRPAGMRERQVIVSADTSWNDAGIDVRAGQTVYIEATGQVRWGKDRRDGPAGERNSPANQARPMPNRNAAALIGRIGNGSRDYFFIGDEKGPIRVRSNGRLYLGVNDDVLTDNSGNFRAVVYY
ncbi:MAG: LecA/PA-IL family lectin [Vicinamibacterales bacterium]